MSSLLLAPSICSSSNLPVINSAAFQQPSLPPLSRFRPQCSPHGFHSRTSTKHYRRSKYTVVNSNGQLDPPPPVPSNSPPAGSGRKGWIAGIVLAILLPFLKNKWGPLLLYKKEADQVMQTVEDTVEVLEKVADEVEKVAEDVEDELPQGQLKNTVVMVEHVAEEVAKDAHIIDAAIHKVQELEVDVETYMNSDSTSRKASKASEESKPNKEQA